MTLVTGSQPSGLETKDTAYCIYHCIRPVVLSVDSVQRICELGSSLQISTSEKWEWKVSLLEKSVFQFGACVICTVCQGHGWAAGACGGAGDRSLCPVLSSTEGARELSQDARTCLRHSGWGASLDGGNGRVGALKV